MKTKIFWIAVMLSLIFLNIINVFASTFPVSISTDSNRILPGDTVELYIDLETESVAYDIEIEVDNDDLIESSELVERLGTGDTSRIYLVQFNKESNRTIYKPDTRIARLKYTISQNAKIGDKIEVTVKGDIVGKNSTEKNPFETSIEIVVGEAESESSNESNTLNEQTENNKTSETNSITNITNNNNSSTETNSNTNSTTSSTKQITGTTITTYKKVAQMGNTIRDTITGKLPKTGAGIAGLVLIIGIISVIIINIIIRLKYGKEKK